MIKIELTKREFDDLFLSTNYALSNITERLSSKKLKLSYEVKKALRETYNRIETLQRQLFR